MASGKWTLISQGAEARVFETTFSGQKCVVKERIKKLYRLPMLDRKLSHRRLIQEARCIIKCRLAGVQTPCVYLVDEERGMLFLEKIEGQTVKVFLEKSWRKNDENLECISLSYHIGVAIAKMHDSDVVHGDLTTSNMMVNDKCNGQVTIIDFGLANSQPLPEDKAVDLYVMERAFTSTHVNSLALIDEVLRAYKACSRHSDMVFQKLAQVRLRGRKRTMVG